MAKKAFYAVKTGKVPGIYSTWAECEAQVKGFSGAEFQKFGTEDAAREFIGSEKKADPVKETPVKIPEAKLAPEDQSVPKFTIPSDIKFGRGEFTSMCDSNFNLTEYYMLPYTSQTSKGIAYLSEHGDVSVAQDGVDHRYRFGDHITDPEQADKMKSLIADHAGYKIDIIIDAARVNGDIARDVFEAELAADEASSQSGDKDVMHIYVDGSYNADTKNYGYGVYMYRGNDADAHIFTGSAPCKANGRNVEGEIQAARVGLQNAKRLGVKEAIVYHDYQGIGSWGDGDWKANKDYTRDYANFVNNLREMGMSVKFEHVDGHTGDKGNEYVDKLAKIACGVSITASEKAFIRELKDVPGYPTGERPISHRDNPFADQEYSEPDCSADYSAEECPF